MIVIIIKTIIQVNITHFVIIIIIIIIIIVRKRTEREVVFL